MTDPVPSKKLAFDAWWINAPRSGSVGPRTAFEAGWDAARAAPEPGLDDLLKQYMETLDDEWQDEIYTTEWGFANRSLPKFVEWLKARTSQPPRDEA